MTTFEKWTLQRLKIMEYCEAFDGTCRDNVSYLKGACRVCYEAWREKHGKEEI